MNALPLEHVLEQITLLRVIWVGLALFTLCLLLMLVTRWGDTKATVKCLVLSLLAHSMLGMYATTVAVVFETPGKAEEPTFQIDRIELVDPGARTPAHAAPPAQLWDAFVRRADVESLPVEIERPKPQPETDPQRPQDAEPVTLPGEMPQLELPVESAGVPEPGQAVQSDAGPQNLVATNTKQPVTAAPQSEAPAETPLPGNPDTRLRPQPKQTEPTRSRSSDVARDELARPQLQRPRRERGPLVEPDGPLADTRDVSARPGEPAEVASKPDPPVSGHERAQKHDAAAQPAVPVSPSLRQRPGFGRKGESDEPARPSPPDPGGVAVLEAAQPSIVPSSGLPHPEQPTPLAARTPNPTEDSLRFRESLKKAAVYRFRTAPNRSELALRHGASEASEAAVQNGLAWLALHQSPDGRWDADGFAAQCPPDSRCLGPAGRDERIDGQDRRMAGIGADTGMTGLALLAFLGAGHTHQGGRYSDSMSQGLHWLIDQQRRDGSLAGYATDFAKNYCHAIAAIALCEAYGMTGDSQLREPAQKALGFIVEMQHPTNGGWRYGRGQRGDTSITGWMLMALKSGQLAGLDVPSTTLDRAVQFLKSVASGEHGGLASYRAGERVKASMTAEALVARQLLGMVRENPASDEAGRYLLDQLPDPKRHNLYYWYYGTVGMYQLGGAYWKAWNDALRDALVNEQVAKGHAAGSWDPQQPWGGYGGRIYSTTLSVLCLEVYYRILPLYKTSGRFDTARRAPAPQRR